MEIKQVLKECQIFSTLDDIELEEIISLGVEKQYEAGTVLFEEGGNAEELLVLREGKVALQMTLPEAPMRMNRKITIDIVTRNEIIGWSAMVEPYTYILTAVCLQNVETLSFNGFKLRCLLQIDPHIDHKVLKKLIDVVASRLDDTRQVLISERLLPLKM